jgi:hypothetical protein
VEEVDSGREEIDLARNIWDAGDREEERGAGLALARGLQASYFPLIRAL